MRGLADVLDLTPRQAILDGAAPGVRQTDPHELLRRLESERPQQHGLGDAEHDGVGADPEREREHGDDAESRMPGQLTDALAQVLRDAIEPREMALVSARVLNPCEECSQCVHINKS